MSLEEDTKIYGRKAAMLKYIHETDPNIPIESHVLVPVDEDWKKYETAINKLGKSLVRSSSPLEDNGRISFAGLFHTAQFGGEHSIEAVLNSVNGKWVKRYARAHNIDPNIIDMHFFFQKESKSRFNWGMLRHPHQENIYIYIYRWKVF